MGDRGYGFFVSIVRGVLGLRPKLGHSTPQTPIGRGCLKKWCCTRDNTNTIRRAGKVMTEQEARQILGVTEEAPWEEIMKKYDNLFENNAKNGVSTSSPKFIGPRNV
ncbi:Mitochondrial import inner membrane translocase subunit tim16 [Spatholobus suberectus]|nr:Mitochondrial import inner membrane translocase subunit tim16 [Spatholobus suberectus]